MRSWAIKKLGELSQRKDSVVSGPFGSNLKVSDYKNEGVPILRLQNIGKGFFIDKDIKFISEQKAEELKYHSFVSGDIALAKLGIPVGKTCIIPNYLKSGIITADVVRIRPDKNVMNYKFLEYFLNTDLSVSQLTGNISGATRPRVNLSDVRDIKTPVPPLPEQQRIVAILDETFAAIAKAKANAEQNFKNAKEIFESYLQGVFENKREGWEIKTIGDVCKVIAGQSPEGKFYNKDRKGLPFYQGKKEYGDKYIGDPTTWTTKVTKEAEANDILMSVRAPVGPINFATQKICIGRGLAAIRATKLIDKEFLFNFLLKHENEIVANTGAVFNSINKAQIESIKIPIPPLPEQQSIVRKLDTLSAETKKLEAVYQSIINNLEELKKSMLQKAFSGELTKIEVVA